MTDEVQMKALKTWRNDEHEGLVTPGKVFGASEQRARELERLGLAAREGGEQSEAQKEPAKVVPHPAPAETTAGPKAAPAAPAALLTPARPKNA